MPLDTRQISLIHESFAKLEPEMPETSLQFYQNLFAIAPETREMFRLDDLGGQGMKFMATLQMVIGQLDDPKGMRAKLADLSAGHAAMGVSAAHYAPMGEALMKTLRDTLGADFTPETEGAWRAAYAELSQAMAP